MFYVVVFVSVSKVKRSSTVCDVLACYAVTSRVAFLSASRITGFVTFYSCKNQYIPKVFRSTVAEYGTQGKTSLHVLEFCNMFMFCLRMVDSCSKEG